MVVEKQFTNCEGYLSKTIIKTVILNLDADLLIVRDARCCQQLLSCQHFCSYFLLNVDTSGTKPNES